MSTRYMIVDDEYLAHDIIMKHASALTNLTHVKSCYDAIEAIEYLSSHTVDLIFLDLNMPKLKGFEFLRTLPSPPMVIVTTAYREYALEGYELNIIDYLLKPFSLERFLKAVNKALMNPPNTKSSLPNQRSPSKTTSNKIILKSEGKYHSIDLSDLLFLESSGNYCRVMLKEQELKVRKKLSTLLEELPSSIIRVHRSFAISTDRITSIEGHQLHIGEHVVPVGKMYRSEVTKIITGLS